MKKTNITQEMREAAEVQIKELQKQIEYDTKDYTLELLISKFKKGDFFIPEYQAKSPAASALRESSPSPLPVSPRSW